MSAHVAASPGIRLSILALGLFVAQSGANARFQAAGPVAIERKYTAGDVDRYRVEFQATVNNPQLGNNVPLKITATIKETTSSIVPPGSAILSDECEQALVKFGDKDLDATQFIPSTTQTRDAIANVVESKTDGRSTTSNDVEPGQLFAIVQRPFYPGRPVRVGDSWRLDAKATRPDGTKLYTTGSATLIGTETVREFATYKVKTVNDISVTNIPTKQNDPKQDPKSAIPSDLKSHFEGIGNVDAKSGKLVRMVGSMDATFGALGRNKIAININLVSPDDKK